MSFVKLFFVVIVFLLIWPPSVHAYIDPGTGSLVIQMVVAGVMAGLYLFKRYWTKIKLFVGHLVNKEGTAGIPPDSPSQEDARS